MKAKLDLDPISGRFLPTPKGQKTAKMLREEKRLGVKFEEDFKDNVLNGKMGQKRFAKRWNVGNRALIFGRNLRGGRRSWIQILGLNFPTADSHHLPERQVACPCCGSTAAPLEKAHWIPRRHGGPATWFNLVDLCPSCHTRLDEDELGVVEEVRAILLLKVAKKLLVTVTDEKTLRKTMLQHCRSIINREDEVAD